MKNVQRTWLIAICAILHWPVCCAVLPAPVQDLSLEAGREFGHTIGDLIRHEIHFRIDAPARFDRASLPASGPLNAWLDLRSIHLDEFKTEHTSRYTLKVVYQIFPALREAESREIPGLVLRAFDKDQSHSFVTPKASVSIAPLIPAQMADAEVAIRPAIAAIPIRLSQHLWIFCVLTLIWAFVLGLWAWRAGTLPFLQPLRRPFARARHELRKWRAAPVGSDEYSQALRSIHRAFNESAGEIVFASSLQNFFIRHPAFQAMRERTEVFFELSEQVFFMQPKDLDTPCTIAWLERFCRDFQRIEGRAS